MRIEILKRVFLFIMFAIIIRLFYWQIIMADHLSALAEGQYLSNIEIKALRGKILFSDSSILASSMPSFSLYGLPKTLNEEQKEKNINKLSEILAEDLDQNIRIDIPEVNLIKKELEEKLSEDFYWILLEKNISLKLKEEIEKLNLPGIGFENRYERFYPEGSSSAHLLGFVGSDARGESKGYFGLEGFFDGELRGRSGLIRHEKDALGLPILIGRFLNRQAQNGKDLVLNIDRSVQFILEQNLKEGMLRYGAKAASAIVMDPMSGAILAMAAYPNYDPGLYAKFPKDYYKNPIVADQYEPGSTFKVLVMAAAINEGVIKPDSKCDICTGSVSLGGFTIRTWDSKYYPDSTMNDVIVHSDNTGMVYVSKKLGLDKFYSYIENFGFGDLTNVDLQDEFSPDLRPKNTWREIDLATASFGQGIAITPIQMITAVSAIANGGFLMEPHIVKTLQDENENYEIKPKVITEVINKDTAKVITEMMVNAVENGEAKAFKPKGFKIAGKTGTAQIPVAGHYDPNKTIASFVGFAPADDPKFVMLVRYDQPTSSTFGSETAAPTFFAIAKELFPYFKIAPTGP